ncbi:hypothetical protein ABIE50_006297 [Chitinophaga sp. OAE865]
MVNQSNPAPRQFPSPEGDLEHKSAFIRNFTPFPKRAKTV